MAHRPTALAAALAAPGVRPAQTIPTRLCAVLHPGGGAGLTSAERKKLALTHKKADQAIAAASRAVNMPT
eukprot:scaffold14837_cov60-Phaeocystis_antarctica.AAC.1